MTFSQYIVCEDPNEWDDGAKFYIHEDAKRYAAEHKLCVVEVTYEYSDSELVDDFRKEGK